MGDLHSASGFTGESLPARATPCLLFDDLVASFARLVEPWVSDVGRAQRSRLVDVVYHYSRNVDARLANIGTDSREVEALARETRRWARGLYLVTLVDTYPPASCVSDEPPSAVRTYDAWWKDAAAHEPELARGALTIEPRLVVTLCRRANLLSAAGWGERTDALVGLLFGETRSSERAVAGASSVCALWYDAIVDACGQHRRAA